MEQRVGSGALRRRLLLAAAALAAFAGLVLALARPERRAALGVRGGASLDPVLAQEAARLFAEDAAAGASRRAEPIPAPVPAWGAGSPLAEVERVRQDLPPCRLRVRVTCGG